jgi:low temperature requirement protein LtrA
VSLAVPGAFGANGITFGVAYLAVRALHLVLYALAGRGDPDLLRAVMRIVPTSVLGPILLVIAGFLDSSVQLTVWGVALAIDYLGVLVGHMQGWRLSPEHFVERHGLVVIIALGESIFAIGIGAAGIPLDTGVIAAALLGIAVAAAVWWSYFDWFIYSVQARLVELTGPERALLARDAYSYLHLPLIAGIVLFALGMKTTLGHVDEPLGAVPTLGLCGGVALYLLVHVALRLRMGGGWGRGRPIAALVLLGMLGFAGQIPALLALSLVALVCALLITYEALAHRESRAFIRERRGAFTTEEALEIQMRERRRRS